MGLYFLPLGKVGRGSRDPQRGRALHSPGDAPPLSYSLILRDSEGPLCAGAAESSWKGHVSRPAVALRGEEEGERVEEGGDQTHHRGPGRRWSMQKGGTEGGGSSQEETVTFHWSKDGLRQRGGGSSVGACPTREVQNEGGKEGTQRCPGHTEELSLA